jgi:hypothetical protein
MKATPSEVSNLIDMLDAFHRSHFDRCEWLAEQFEGEILEAAK